MTVAADSAERSEALATSADIVIMTISVEDGWTSKDTKLLERIQNNKSESGLFKGYHHKELPVQDGPGQCEQLVPTKDLQDCEVLDTTRDSPKFLAIDIYRSCFDANKLRGICSGTR
ncbi:hypothetical protein M9H77_23488 [Catharanthus roseus]|uniref:Uncharacterized protein n=1 Tax=Catharanthus roseus TaxID=4058 RepID=A0ACC0ATH4_CATRO|nr:hypothetical protein M9H77_23488 [Catharanthus roseus]